MAIPEFPLTEKEAKKEGVPYSSDENKGKPFPKRLRDLREGRGISQSALAKVLEVSKSTVGLWETGDTLPDAKSVYKLAQYYGVSSDYLLGLSKHPSTDVNVRAMTDFWGLSERAAIEFAILSNPANHQGHRFTALSKLLEQSTEFEAILDGLDFCTRFGSWPTYFEQALSQQGIEIEGNLKVIARSDRAQNRTAAIYTPQFWMGEIAKKFVEQSEKDAENETSPGG